MASANETEFWKDSFDRAHQELQIREHTNNLLRKNIQQLMEENEKLRKEHAPRFLQKVIRFTEGGPRV